MSRACDLYLPNKFHALYRRVEYALNTFGARLRHVIVCYMRVPILLDAASVVLASTSVSGRAILHVFLISTCSKGSCVCNLTIGNTECYLLIYLLL